MSRISGAIQGKHQPATEFIDLIGKLYAAESHANNATPRQRARIRRRNSRAVLGEIKALLDRHLGTTTPSGLLGKALNYLAEQWPKLNRYVDNGFWPINKNACENASCPFVVGRRAWLFADTVGGANASANLYSLIETCKANHVEPYAYLGDLFRVLPYANSADDYTALLPWQLGKAQGDVIA